MACHTLCHRGQASVKRNWWGSRTKKLLKNMAAASKSRTFAPSASSFFFLFPASPPTLLFISFLMPRTSQQATAICMMCSASAFLQLFRSVRLPAPACGCLYLSVCASVNVCGLTASKLKLQEGGGKKPIDISYSNQGNMLKYVTGEVRHLACIFNSV